jgi:hypothetical protein
MTSEMKVTLTANSSQPVSEIAKLQAAATETAKSFAQVTKTATEGSKNAKNSFNALQRELTENVAILKRMEAGTAAFDQQKAKVDGLRRSLDGANKSIAKSGNSIADGLRSGVSQVASLVTGMASFQTIVTAVVSELEKAKQLRLDAAETTRTFEQALADIGQNIGAGNIDEAKKIIIEQAPALGVDQKGFANLLGIAISAGAKDLKEATALSAAALKLTVGDANKAAALVGGTLDVASLGGSTNFEGALGQLLQTQSQVRSTNLSEFAANIGPGLAAATAKGQNMEGVSTERALEMASVVSQIIKDQTGSNTATTIRQFFTRLDSFSPEASKKLDDGGTATVSQQVLKQFSATRSFEDKLALFRDNEGLALQFLETQRESIGKTAIREILVQSDRAKGFEEKAKTNITGIDAGQQFFSDLVNKVGTETIALTAERQSQANLQAAQVTSGRGLEGEAVKIVEDTMKQIDMSGIDYFREFEASAYRNQEAAAGRSQIDAAIYTLEAFKKPTVGLGFIPLGGQVSEKDKATIDTQLKLLEVLKARQEQEAAAADRMVQALNRNNEVLANIERNQRGNAPAKPPARPPVERAPIAGGLAQ